MSNQEIVERLKSIIVTLNSKNYKRDPIRDGIDEINTLISELDNSES